MGNYSVLVIDFETTGLSPDYGDRAIEIGAILIQNNHIVDRFQSLINPGMRISSFISEYTGITNQMLKKAPPADEVMQRFVVFMADHHLVAHNASFDRRFLDAELYRIQSSRNQEFACSMLLSRRVYPEAPRHNLESLIQYRNIQTDGIFHRALADAEMTARLWISMIDDLKERYGLGCVPFELLQKISRMKKDLVPGYLEKMAGNMQSKYIS
ncbi:MAG: 3'-5' exonuclease [Desulfatirhabdiaceae bacterium]